MFTRIIIFGGKGGVGKSTTSAATAIYLAKLNPEKKIFLISFDIAHNLGDLFDMEIGDKITQVLPNLWAMEPDADRYTEDYTRDFVEKAKKLLYDLPLVKKLTNLEQYIEESFSAASIPLAVKNSIFFDQILESENDYDYFIVDMPPTGNMVSIFEVPKTTMQVFLKSTLETMDKVLEFVAAMRKLNPVNWFRPGANERRKNQAAELLGKLKELDRRNDRIMRMLKTLTSLRLVTIAERPSYEEIRRAADLVKKYVPLEGVVINKLNHDGIDCKYCSTETIHQKKYVKMIEEDEHFKDKKIWRTWRMEDEVIGVDKLLEFAKSLYKDETFETIVRPLRLVGPGDA